MVEMSLGRRQRIGITKSSPIAKIRSTSSQYHLKRDSVVRESIQMLMVNNFLDAT